MKEDKDHISRVLARINKEKVEEYSDKKQF